MQKVVHFEIPVDDIARAKNFYSIFGWDLQDWPMADGSTYVGASSVAVDETTRMPKEVGAINGGIVQRDQYTKTPSITIDVPSIEDYIEKVKAAGGSVIKDKQSIEGMGAYAYIADTEGNQLGLWESLKQ